MLVLCHQDKFSKLKGTPDCHSHSLASVSDPGKISVAYLWVDLGEHFFAFLVHFVRRQISASKEGQHVIISVQSAELFPGWKALSGGLGQVSDTICIYVRQRSV